MNLKQVGKITDLKSIAIGFLLGICVMLLAGAGANDQGPYQSRQAGTNDMAVFVIDTRDGHIWRMGRGICIDFGTPIRPVTEPGATEPSVK